MRSGRPQILFATIATCTVKVAPCESIHAWSAKAVSAVESTGAATSVSAFEHAADGSLERSCQFVEKGYSANGSSQRLLQFIAKMEEPWYQIILPPVSVINSGMRDEL